MDVWDNIKYTTFIIPVTQYVYMISVWISDSKERKGQKVHLKK